MPNKKTAKKGNMGKAIAVGAGVAAAGAAAYMLIGPNGKKNRAKVKAFAKKAKNAVANNKEMIAMASMAAKAMTSAKAKAKAGVKKAKSTVKKGVGAAKKSVKGAISKAKKSVKKGAR